MPDLKRLLPAIAIAALLALPAVAAEEERPLFTPGGFEEVAIGERVIFRHERSAAEPVAPIVGGEAAILLAENGGDGARELRVTLTSEGREVPVPPMPASTANPILLIFLENNVRNMAEATGGSPFYIRNRMRDALWGGGPREAVTVETANGNVSGERVAIRPFAEDPNRAEMGAFADLEIRFVLSDDVPGRIALLDAEAGAGPEGMPALRETFTFDRLEKGD